MFACSDSFFPHIADGCYAEYASVAERHLALLPPHLSFEEGAAIPLVALTAWQVWGSALLLSGCLGGCLAVAVWAACLPACLLESRRRTLVPSSMPYPRP